MAISNYTLNLVPFSHAGANCRSALGFDPGAAKSACVVADLKRHSPSLAVIKGLQTSEEGEDPGPSGAKFSFDSPGEAAPSSADRAPSADAWETLAASFGESVTTTCFAEGEGASAAPGFPPHWVHSGLYLESSPGFVHAGDCLPHEATYASRPTSAQTLLICLASNKLQNLCLANI